jgi:hypothetical protein
MPEIHRRDRGYRCVRIGENRCLGRMLIRLDSNSVNARCRDGALAAKKAKLGLRPETNRPDLA